ncbi:MAG: DUF6460 domain-containing protein [Hyphomicrobiaceae bacterium]
MDRQIFFGGNIWGVLVRLVLLSVVVGIVLSALGISLENFFYQLKNVVQRLYDIGFGAFNWVLSYFLLGAMVVFPIWIAARLLRSLGRRSPPVAANRPGDGQPSLPPGGQ